MVVAAMCVIMKFALVARNRLTKAGLSLSNVESES